METRYITDKDFLSLADLYTEVQAPLSNREKQDYYSTATSHLCDQMKRPDFRAFGLFDEGKLVGFSLGYAKSTKCFHFSAIYVTIKNNRNLKKFLDFSISEVEKGNYCTWEADCINPNIMSILEKWNAKTDFTRMVKEIKHG